MPHTSSRYQADLGFTDGIIYVSALSMFGAANSAFTKNAVGDFSMNTGASLAAVIDIPILDMSLVRTGFGEDLQEQFGGTGIPASAQPQPYRPDVIAGMATLQQITPRTALKVKGIKPISLKLVYLITGSVPSLHTVRVDKIAHANNVANAITSVIANGANGLQTAVQANPYVTVVPFPANQQVYQITDLATLWAEVAVTTIAAGAYRLYSAELSCEFNYN